ncbi:unnamed protein product, partial [Agarophyton chilense]
SSESKSGKPGEPKEGPNSEAPTSPNGNSQKSVATVDLKSSESKSGGPAKPKEATTLENKPSSLSTTKSLSSDNNSRSANSTDHDKPLDSADEHSSGKKPVPCSSTDLKTIQSADANIQNPLTGKGLLSEAPSLSKQGKSGREQHIEVESNPSVQGLANVNKLVNEGSIDFKPLSNQAEEEPPTDSSVVLATPGHLHETTTLEGPKDGLPSSNANEHADSPERLSGEEHIDPGNDEKTSHDSQNLSGPDPSQFEPQKSDGLVAKR